MGFEDKIEVSKIDSTGSTTYESKTTFWKIWRGFLEESSSVRTREVLGSGGLLGQGQGLLCRLFILPGGIQIPRTFKHWYSGSYWMYTFRKIDFAPNSRKKIAWQILDFLWCVWGGLFFETAVSYIVQDGFKLTLILLPHPPENWDHGPRVEIMFYIFIFFLIICTFGYLYVHAGTYGGLGSPWSWSYRLWQVTWCGCWEWNLNPPDLCHLSSPKQFILTGSF